MTSRNGSPCSGRSRTRWELQGRGDLVPPPDMVLHLGVLGKGLVSFRYEPEPKHEKYTAILWDFSNFFSLWVKLFYPRQCLSIVACSFCVIFSVHYDITYWIRNLEWWKKKANSKRFIITITFSSSNMVMKENMILKVCNALIFWIFYHCLLLMCFSDVICCLNLGFGIVFFHFFLFTFILFIQPYQFWFSFSLCPLLLPCDLLPFVPWFVSGSMRK